MRISKQGMSHLMCVAALAAGLLVQPARANPGALREAQELLAKGNAKEAFVKLAAIQDKNLSNQEFNYLLGVAALDSMRYDEAIIAFERVLAVQRNHAGALLDLGRAYFHTGSLDLAETTLLALKRANPPAAARATIERYLTAIRDKRTQSRRKVSLWGEAQLGYDTNLTGVPVDFTSAVLSAFNLAGITPTGNAIKRRAPFGGAALGIDYQFPLGAQWGAQLGADVRGRGYQKETLFNVLNGDVRAGINWTQNRHRISVTAHGNAFKQKADAPGDPKPTNDRHSAGVSGEYRYAIAPQNQLSLGLTGLRVRFPDNDIEDLDARQISLGWLRQFEGARAPLFQLSAYSSRDEALRTLADGLADKSKTVSGIRIYSQINVIDSLNVFANLGYATRNDDTAFARATEIEFGRDNLADLTLGWNWRFTPTCNLQSQWQASRNRSNIAIYDYKRQEISSAVRCEIQ